MKYVFIIHSHTTFLTAMGVRDFLKIDNEDVIFLYSRNYSNSLIQPRCKIIDVNDLISKQSQLWSNNKRKILIREIDEMIDHVIKDNYILYTPHFGMPFAQVLYTNKKCMKGAYIQEGGITFHNAYITHLNILQKIRCFVAAKIYRRSNRVWSTYGWYMPNSLYKQKTIDSYATSNDFFKYLPSINHIIKWPSVDIDFSYRKDANFFIFDGFIKHDVIEPEFYFEKCKQLIEKFAKPFNYIKFHPVQSNMERDYIVSYFAHASVKYEIMNDSIPFECVLSTMKGLTITGFGSSLLFFARDLGHKVNCMDKWLQESPKYIKYKTHCGFEDF